MKIPYAPQNNVTLAIIQKANRTFDGLAQIMELAQHVAVTAQQFLEILSPVSEGINKVCHSLGQVECLYYEHIGTVLQR